MNSKQVGAELLINEWQLGPQLNIALTEGARDKFNLLLSLLSDDARDLAQFSFTPATEADSPPIELRTSLHLPAAQPLVNRGISAQQAQRLSVALHENQLADLRLHCLLNNEALLSRQTEADIDAEVVDNLSFLAQTRLLHGHNSNGEVQHGATGIDHQLMESYQALNLNADPVKVRHL